MPKITKADLQTQVTELTGQLEQRSDDLVAVQAERDRLLLDMDRAVDVERERDWLRQLVDRLTASRAPTPVSSSTAWSGDTGG